MANDLTAFNSEAWSTALVTRLDQTNIMLPLVNRKWEGDLRLNKTVWVRTTGNITMRTYARGDTITYEDLKPVKEAFTVDDGSYFAFEVDDLDKAQSNISAMSEYTKRAVISLNDTIEAKILAIATTAVLGSNLITQAVAGTGATATSTVVSGSVTACTVTGAGSSYATPPIVSFSGGGGMGARAHCVMDVGANADKVGSIVVDYGGVGYTTAPTVTLSDGTAVTLTNSTTAATGIYPLFCAARAKMSKANVPNTPGSRWAVIDPDTTTLLLTDTDHFIRAGELGDKIVQYGLIGGEEVARTAANAPGFIGMMAGFMVYETPHVVTATAGSPPVNEKFLLFGDNDAVSYAAQITEIEVLRLQTTFANAVRGLLLHDAFVPAESAKRLVAIKARAA